VNLASTFSENDDDTMVILFSSPNPNRWMDPKGSFYCPVGFGMELWSEKELSRMAAIFLDYTSYLCSENDVNKQQISTILKEFGLDNSPDTYKRKDLFGMQPRFEFNPSKDVLSAMRGLKQVFTEVIQKRDVLTSPANKNDDYKIVKLEFDLDNRVFNQTFISQTILSILVRYIEKEKDGIFKELLDGTSTNRGLYGCLFEKYVDHLLVRGVSIKKRTLLEKDLDTDELICKCGKRDLCFKKVGKIQMWYENINNAIYLFGLDTFRNVKENVGILLGQKLNGCATVDSIVIQFKQGKYEVIFIQSTVRNTHTVSIAGFFGMLMLVNSIRHYSKKNVTVKFYFVVDKSNYSIFNTSEAKYLTYLFDEIEIGVVKIDEFVNPTNNPTTTTNTIDDPTTTTKTNNPITTTNTTNNPTTATNANTNTNNNSNKFYFSGSEGLHFPFFNLNKVDNRDLFWRDIYLSLDKEKITVISNVVELQINNKENNNTPNLIVEQFNNNTKKEENNMVKKLKKKINNQKEEKISVECFRIYNLLFQTFIQKKAKNMTDEEDQSDGEENNNKVQDITVKNTKTSRAPRGIGQKCRYFIVIWFCNVFTKEDISRVLGCWGLRLKCDDICFLIDESSGSDSDSGGGDDGGLLVKLKFFDRNIVSITNYFCQMKPFIDSGLISIGEIEKEIGRGREGEKEKKGERERKRKVITEPYDQQRINNNNNNSDYVKDFFSSDDDFSPL
jgi:hypothetical protein